MNHFYMINNNFKKFKISKILKKKKIRINNSDYEVKKISTFKELSAKINLKRKFINLPYKDAAFIKKRYFENPKFKYEIFLILKKKINSRSFFINREIFIINLKH